MIQKPILRATLRAMNPGESERIPVGMFKHNTIRNAACLLGYDLLRKYSVHLDRAAGYYTITRVQ